MPVISQFFGIKVTMYYDDHNPPHFHVEYNDDKALIDIVEARVLSGYLKSKQLKLVLSWCIIHQEELLENWKRSEEGEELVRIAPLM